MSQFPKQRKRRFDGSFSEEKRVFQEEEGVWRVGLRIDRWGP